MEKIKISWARRILKILMWVFLVLVGLFILAVIARLIYRINEAKVEAKTNAEVEKIHNTKLSLDDVLGKNLPPDPGALADQTIAGIDANNNGIRDDVELAIFNAYPNSAKTRAVLLQYALALQLEITLPVLNTSTATAIEEDNYTRAHICIWSISSRSNMEKFVTETNKNESFIEQLQFNTDQRKKAENNFSKYIRSYSASNKSCDLDLKTLPN
jgi:hypothetical protein